MNTYKMITKECPFHMVSEQYIKLKTNIDYSSIDKPLQVINITSTVANEGKTLTALNLANVYAQTKTKVLLIDMDLRNPTIHKAFDIKNIGGLTDYILGKKRLDESVNHISPYFDVIHTGEKIPFPAELLTSNKVKDMFNELKKQYEMIIIDCPPLSAVADALMISNLADGTLYVIASRSIDKKVAQQMIKDLKENSIHVIGGILTKVKKTDLNYGKDYYYYYGN